jgi:tRNA-2-methylthio-N6-dimethylallyladenosine synthase
MKLVDEIGFDASFSFVYSRRPGTPAADLPDDTPHAVKLGRLQQLQRKIEERSQAINHTMVGTRQRVLADGMAKKNPGELCGRTDNNRVVNFSAPARVVGSFVEVAITAALPHSLRGELVGAFH